MRNKTLKYILGFAALTVITTSCYQPSFDYEEVNIGKLNPPTVDRNSTDYRQKYSELEKYDEEVTIKVAVATCELENDVKVGTNCNNQSFNKIAKDVLNINLEYVVTGSAEYYSTKLKLAITNGDMPDMFYLSDNATYSQLLKDDMLADLSDTFWYLNDELQQNYLEYFPELLPAAMNDSKLYALPAITNNYAAAQRLYVRQDWLDIIGKSAPKTIEEMQEIGRLFIEKKEDIAKATGIPANLVVPFTFNKELTNTGSYSAKGFFNSFGSNLNSYFADDNNNLYYSNTSNETKQALSALNQMYKDGSLNQNFLSSDASSIQSYIKSGYVGMVFGEWWMAKDVLDDCVTNVDGSNWTWVDLPGANGKEALPIVDTVSISGYNVVSKSCKHPEAAARLINLFYDIYYNDNAQAVYGDGVLPSNGFYYQFVPIKLWDGAASMREYYRVQEVFNNLYNKQFDPSTIVDKDTYANNAIIQIVKSVTNDDYVVSTSNGNYNIINRDVVNAINSNPDWKTEFDKLRKREKILHFADGYPYFVALKKNTSIKDMSKAEKAGWGIYHEMIDENGGYAYVVQLTEGKKKAKYNCFYGANLSSMNEYIEYINTQTNVVFTEMIKGTTKIDSFESDYVDKIFNNNGGTTIIEQVNQWYKSHNLNYDEIYSLVK